MCLCVCIYIYAGMTKAEKSISPIIIKNFRKGQVDKNLAAINIWCFFSHNQIGDYFRRFICETMYILELWFQIEIKVSSINISICDAKAQKVLYCHRKL